MLKIVTSLKCRFCVRIVHGDVNYAITRGGENYSRHYVAAQRSGSRAAGREKHISTVEKFFAAAAGEALD